jgi:hypothetical protein
MSWEELPLEKHVQWLLEEKLKSEGEKLWTLYQQTRNELVTEVLPWIAKYGEGLTDHGVEHIRNVINNASRLLGFKNHFDGYKTIPYSDVSPHEMLILLAGLLWHDVGNIYGRERHNQKILEVWNKLPSWQSWGSHERQIVIEVGRAHSGKDKDGSKDTLKALSVAQRYFYQQPVKIAPIAAIVRFADELAEGPQRTSNFLIENGLIEKNSEIFHQYAQITQVSIDRDSGRVALTYHINIDNSSYPKDKDELRQYLQTLLKMVYARAIKMNQERQLTRHYANVLAPFRETSISVTFLENDNPIELPLDPIILNDINIFGETTVQIEQLNSNYKIDELVERVIGDFSAKIN